MNKFELETLVAIRIKDAEVLLNAGCYPGAYYLAGYAVECALKACIAKQVKEFDFPDKILTHKSYTHDLSVLMTTAELTKKLKEQELFDEEFQLNWFLVKDWSEQARYNDSITKQDAENLFNAIIHNKSGILPWLKKFL